MNRSSILALLALLLPAATRAQGPPIPVYPGATLVAGEGEGSCCGFVTRDGHAKVLAFYEKALGSRPLDAKALVARYPATKAQVEMLARQLPPGAAWTAFVVGEVRAGAYSGPQLFEVLSAAGATRFTIPAERLSGKDDDLARQWRERTGQLTDEDRAAKARADQERADAAEEEAEIEARRKQLAASAPRIQALLAKAGVPLFPGARLVSCAGTGAEDRNSVLCRFAAPAPYEKVIAYYQSWHPQASKPQEGAEDGDDDAPMLPVLRMARVDPGSRFAVDVLELRGPRGPEVRTGIWVKSAELRSVAGLDR